MVENQSNKGANYEFLPDGKTISHQESLKNNNKVSRVSTKFTINNGTMDLGDNSTIDLCQMLNSTFKDHVFPFNINQSEKTSILTSILNIVFITFRDLENIDNKRDNLIKVEDNCDDENNSINDSSEEENKDLIFIESPILLKVFHLLNWYGRKVPSAKLITKNCEGTLNDLFASFRLDQHIIKLDKYKKNREASIKCLILTKFYKFNDKKSNNKDFMPNGESKNDTFMRYLSLIVVRELNDKESNIIDILKSLLTNNNLDSVALYDFLLTQIWKIETTNVLKVKLADKFFNAFKDVIEKKPDFEASNEVKTLSDLSKLFTKNFEDIKFIIEKDSDCSKIINYHINCVKSYYESANSKANNNKSVENKNLVSVSNFDYESTIKHNDTHHQEVNHRRSINNSCRNVVNNKNSINQPSLVKTLTEENVFDINRQSIKLTTGLSNYIPNKNSLQDVFTKEQIEYLNKIFDSFNCIDLNRRVENLEHEYENLKESIQQQTTRYSSNSNLDLKTSQHSSSTFNKKCSKD